MAVHSHRLHSYGIWSCGRVIVLAVMGYIVMGYWWPTAVAFIAMADTVMAYKVVANGGVAYIVMADVVTAYNCNHDP